MANVGVFPSHSTLAGTTQPLDRLGLPPLRMGSFAYYCKNAQDFWRVHAAACTPNNNNLIQGLRRVELFEKVYVM